MTEPTKMYTFNENMFKKQDLPSIYIQKNNNLKHE